MSYNPPEPEIIMNGVKLNYAQSMCMRVALESFSFTVHKGEDEIDALYMARIEEIRKFMYANNPHYIQG